MSCTAINPLSFLGSEYSPFSANLPSKLEDPLSLDSIQPSNYSPPTRPRRLSRAQAHRENISPERAKHLERNRIAANKCREKKKRENVNLQATLDVASSKHKALETEVEILQEEIWHLKNQLFAHALCDDQQINCLLNRMANKVQQGGAENPSKYPSPPLSMNTPPGQPIANIGMVSGSEDVIKRETDGLFDTFVDLPCA